MLRNYMNIHIAIHSRYAFTCALLPKHISTHVLSVHATACNKYSCFIICNAIFNSFFPVFTYSAVQAAGPGVL